jgi:hypothetical protein
LSRISDHLQPAEREVADTCQQMLDGWDGIAAE